MGLITGKEKCHLPKLFLCLNVFTVLSLLSGILNSKKVENNEIRSQLDTSDRLNVQKISTQITTVHNRS